LCLSKIKYFFYNSMLAYATAAQNIQDRHL